MPINLADAFRGVCRVGRLSRWVDAEHIMSDEADTVGIEKWDGKFELWKWGAVYIKDFTMFYKDNYVS